MTKINHLLLAGFCTAILNFACASGANGSLETLKKQPERQAEQYNGSIELNIEDRILPAPPRVINYLNRMDNTDRYRNHPVNESEKKLLLDYIDFLPQAFRDAMQDNLLAIYVIEDFTGGGMTDFVFDKHGELRLILYLNSLVFQKSLSEWISYRENSAFSASVDGALLVAECSDTYRGLLHTLLHEASHIYDFVHHATPFVEPILADAYPVQSDFVQAVWKGYDSPQPAFDFAKRRAVLFYGLGKPLERSLAIDLYTNLAHSPFSSLYGSKTWAEDFAETYSWYYMRKVLGITCTIRLIEKGETVLSYNNTGNELVTQRYEHFQKLGLP